MSWTTEGRYPGRDEMWLTQGNKMLFPTIDVNFTFIRRVQIKFLLIYIFHGLREVFCGRFLISTRTLLIITGFMAARLRLYRLCHGSSAVRYESKVCLFFPERWTRKMKVHQSWSDESGMNQLSLSSIQIHPSNLFLICSRRITSPAPPCSAWAFWNLLLELTSCSMPTVQRQQDAAEVKSSQSFDSVRRRRENSFHPWDSVRKVMMTFLNVTAATTFVN